MPAHPRATVLQRVATLIGATELADFVVRGDTLQRRSRPVQHLRPDESDAGVRAAALVEFQRIIAGCIESLADRAVRVADTDGFRGPQYCLVVLERADRRIAGAAAFIARCHDDEDAESVLDRARRLIRRLGPEGEAAVPAA